MTASLNHRFYIIAIHRCIRSITRSCIVCRRESAKPQLQTMGKLPVERIVPAHPGTVFATIGIMLVL